MVRPSYMLEKWRGGGGERDITIQFKLFLDGLFSKTNTLYKYFMTLKDKIFLMSWFLYLNFLLKNISNAGINIRV